MKIAIQALLDGRRAGVPLAKLLKIKPHGPPIEAGLRHRLSIVSPVDLDSMDTHTLKRLALAKTSYDPETMRNYSDPWMRKLFPTRPTGFQQTAWTLRLMAQARIRGEGAQFETLYRTLPRWAQWRRSFAIKAAAVPGQKFRARPLKQKYTREKTA